MKVWEITAVTNFILAGEAFLAAGILLGRVPLAPSAAVFWALAMLFLALGTLLGGLDHGFFEPKGDTRGRKVMQKTTWICTGVLAFFSLQTAAWQFGAEGWRAPAALIGLAQLAAFCYFAIRRDSFLTVILNYAPILLILLALNIAGLPAGKGSWAAVAGLLIAFAASAAQALGVDSFSPVDRNGLYHIVMLAAVAFLFLGGLTLPA
jgi:hypothetical protein